MQTLAQAFRNTVAQHQTGRLTEAESGYRRILAAAPGFAPAWQMLGVLAFQQRQYAQAVQCLQKAIALGAGADAHHNLGEALRALNRTDEAVTQYQLAIEQNFNMPASHSSLGAALNEMGRFHDAIPHLRRALELQPAFPNALFNYGVALDQTGRTDDAITQWEKTLDLSASHMLAINHLTRALIARREPERALQHVLNAHRLKLDDPIYRLDCAHLLLLLDRYEEGFAEYEWRYRTRLPGIMSPEFAQPAWNGSDPAGRVILVHVEQGFGDIIQFSRYIPMLVERGAGVVVSMVPEMAELIGSISPDIRVIPSGQRLPDFDLHVSVMSLPHLFKTTRQTIPARIPYLFANPARIEMWRARIDAHANDGAALKVGVVWGGRPVPDPFRSMPLSALAPLATITNVCWFSLQTGEPAKQLDTPPQGMNLLDVGRDMKDFSDTAAVMSLMDLVITIDTATAHVGGALGVPTWTMLPQMADWRWLTEGPFTPWYPGMRLYRQEKHADWTSVVEAVASDLQGMAVTKAESGRPRPLPRNT